ncbi:MAG: septum formation initiator family protein [Bacteroidales bacterium]|nr:septum formation initiator family protein [Bacteroidales bacterium]
MKFSEFKQTRFFKIIKNKYLIATLVFAVLILFTPGYNIIYHNKLRKQLHELEDRRDVIKQEIKSDSLRILELQKDIKTLEKFGREKYMMKKENEDIYVIKEKDTLSNHVSE